LGFLVFVLECVAGFSGFVVLVFYVLGGGWLYLCIEKGGFCSAFLTAKFLIGSWLVLCGYGRTVTLLAMLVSARLYFDVQRFLLMTHAFI
jgi:hypothetical protein